MASTILVTLSKLTGDLWIQSADPSFTVTVMNQIMATESRDTCAKRGAIIMKQAQGGGKPTSMSCKNEEEQVYMQDRKQRHARENDLTVSAGAQIRERTTILWSTSIGSGEPKTKGLPQHPLSCLTI